MAKALNLLIAFLLFSAGAGAAVLSKRDCVQEKYTSQIGVREATGHNDGYQVEIYLKTVKASKGASWCAAFVNWCFEQCGIKAAGSAWSPSWFPASRTIWKRSSGTDPPAKGDVFGIYFASKKRVAHVGFIDRWEGDYAYTVEGNTNEAGSREGDGVYRKRRLKRQIYAVSRWVN